MGGAGIMPRIIPPSDNPAHAYDKAAKELHGEFAWLNFMA
jgi:hypothetical protein